MNKILILLSFTVLCFGASVSEIEEAHKKAYAKADGDAISAIAKELKRTKDDAAKAPYLELLKKIDPSNPLVGADGKAAEGTDKADPYAAYKIPATAAEWEKIPGKIYNVALNEAIKETGIKLNEGQEVAIMPNPEDLVRWAAGEAWFDYTGMRDPDFKAKPEEKKNPFPDKRVVSLTVCDPNVKSKTAVGQCVYANNIVKGPFRINLGWNAYYINPKGEGMVRVKIVPVEKKK